MLRSQCSPCLLPRPLLASHRLSSARRGTSYPLFFEPPRPLHRTNGALPSHPSPSSGGAGSSTPVSAWSESRSQPPRPSRRQRIWDNGDDATATSTPAWDPQPRSDDASDTQAVHTSPTPDPQPPPAARAADSNGDAGAAAGPPITPAASAPGDKTQDPAPSEQLLEPGSNSWGSGAEEDDPGPPSSSAWAQPVDTFSGSGWQDTDWGQAEPVWDWDEASGTASASGPQAGSYTSPQPGQWTGSSSSSSGAWTAGGGSMYSGANGTGQYSGGAQGASGQYSGGASAGPQGGKEVFADATQGGGPYDPSSMLSDITILSRQDTDSILPLAPTGKQSDFYQPRTLQERIVQLLGSLGASMMLSKVVVLAGPALLYPLWSPWIRAGLRNLELYAKQFKYVGLWRAKVMEVEVSGWQFPGASGAAIVRLTVGDGWPGGARVQLEFPYQARAELVQAGEPAELLVLCKDDAFVSFKVVRELYLPESGLWLAEYPFVERGAFLDVSLGIEQARQAQSTQQQWQ